MQTKLKKVRRNWKWRNFFDKSLRKELAKKLSGYKRVIGMSIFLGIFFHFFAIGIIPSSSMFPTLHVDDAVFYVRTSHVGRGDVVCFLYPLDESKTYVKRLIGLPGDEVEVKEGKVWVNGVVIAEDYILEKPTYTIAKQIVPADSYFVLGDNRNNSDDSSVWGFLKKDKLKGKGVAVILPVQRIHLLQ
jgi:signal peptidase I